MNKKQTVIAGGLGAVVLSGIGVFAYNQTMQKPENLFLSRIAANYAQKEPATAFQMKLEQNGGDDFPLFDLEISGQAHGNQETYALSVEPFQIGGFDIPEISLIKDDKDVYINGEFVSFLLEMQAQFQGNFLDLEESAAGFKGKYLVASQAIKDLWGQEAYNEFQASFEQTGDSKALNKEIQDALAKFLKQVDDSSYTKNGTDVTLTLEKDQVKELLKLVLETFQKSEHYHQGNQDLDKFLSDFDYNFDLIFGAYDPMDLSITLGEKVGQAKTVLTFEEATYQDFKIDVIYNLEPITYVKPTKPQEIIESDVIKKLKSDIEEEQLYLEYYDDYYYTYYDSAEELTKKQIDELEKEYKKDGLDIEEKAEIDALRDILDEQ